MMQQRVPYMQQLRCIQHINMFYVVLNGILALEFRGSYWKWSEDPTLNTESRVIPLMSLFKV